MELGEMMEVISRKIEVVAAAEFEKSGLPPGLRPIVMQTVTGRFYAKAYGQKTEERKE
jgi:hypothetical protein